MVQSGTCSAIFSIRAESADRQNTKLPRPQVKLQRRAWKAKLVGQIRDIYKAQWEAMKINIEKPEIWNGHGGRRGCCKACAREQPCRPQQKGRRKLRLYPVLFLLEHLRLSSLLLEGFITDLRFAFFNDTGTAKALWTLGIELNVFYIVR